MFCLALYLGLFMDIVPSVTLIACGSSFYWGTTTAAGNIPRVLFAQPLQVTSLGLIDDRVWYRPPIW